MKLIKNTELDTIQFENKKVPETIFDGYNLENLNVFALLFQTGYLSFNIGIEFGQLIIVSVFFPDSEHKPIWLINVSLNKKNKKRINS